MSIPVVTVQPAGDPTGSVLIVHGLAEHKGRYAYVQQRLADAGYVSHAIDLRGHGEAEGFPGKVSSPDELIDDVAEGAGVRTFICDRALDGDAVDPRLPG